MTWVLRGAEGHALGHLIEEKVIFTGDPHHLKSREFPFEPMLQNPQDETSCLPALFAWEGTGIALRPAKQPRRGTVETPYARGQTQAGSSTSGELSYAWTGSGPTGAQTQLENISTNALDVGQPNMGQTSAVSQNPRIMTPLVASEWSLALRNANLLQRYPHIPTFISLGTDAGIPTINSTFAPPNRPSVDVHKEVFLEIVNNEFAKGWYWGPFSKEEVESIIGPFQTSPLSLIPKPGKPSKF